MCVILVMMTPIKVHSKLVQAALERSSTIGRNRKSRIRALLQSGHATVKSKKAKAVKATAANAYNAKRTANGAMRYGSTSRHQPLNTDDNTANHEEIGSLIPYTLVKTTEKVNW